MFPHSFHLIIFVCNSHFSFTSMLISLCSCCNAWYIFEISFFFVNNNNNNSSLDGVLQIFSYSLWGLKVVSHCQTFLHGAAEEGLASPHDIQGSEKNVLWLIGISLNQSRSSWAVLSAVLNGGAAAKIASGRNLFWCMFKSSFSRAT